MRKSIGIHLKLIHVRVAAVKTQVRVQQDTVSELITNGASDLSNLWFYQNFSDTYPRLKMATPERDANLTPCHTTQNGLYFGNF